MDAKKTVQNFLRNLPRNAASMVASGMRLLPGEVPKTVYLELHGDYPVFAPKSILPIAIPIPGQKKSETLKELKVQLEAIAQVAAVEEIVILERGFSGGFATLFAVRQMFVALVAAGKTVTFYADGYSNLTLYLASACSKVVTLSEGQLLTVGLAGRVLFQANMFKKIGVEIEYERRSEYKNAPNQLTETSLTDSHREALSSLLGSINTHWLEAIATGRKLELEAVQKAVDAAPLLAHEALTHGLLTETAFEDELTLNAKPLLEAQRFAIAPKPDWSATGGVALIGIEGGISDGESKNNPLPIPIFGGQSAGGYSVARAIRKAAQDENIKAIVLYVDSPGGSALASEIIWREVTRAKTVKPVVAVMGNVAASGGYYVSCAATRILAAPSTITGSIGVFMLHLSNAGLWEKLGFTTETIKMAQHSDFFSPDRLLSSSEKENVNKSVQHIYDTFKTRVANGRNLSLEAVETVAKGRVWTGLQAFENGLVDEIGTVFDGLQVARALAGLPESAPTIQMTPPPKYIAPTDLAAMTKVLETRIWALMPEQLEIR
jgi:protease IV